jgi:hypothetical protein
VSGVASNAFAVAEVVAGRGQGGVEARPVPYAFWLVELGKEPGNAPAISLLLGAGCVGRKILGCFDFYLDCSVRNLPMYVHGLYRVGSESELHRN